MYGGNACPPVTCFSVGLQRVVFMREILFSSISVQFLHPLPLAVWLCLLSICSSYHQFPQQSSSTSLCLWSTVWVVSYLLRLNQNMCPFSVLWLLPKLDRFKSSPEKTDSIHSASTQHDYGYACSHVCWEDSSLNDEQEKQKRVTNSVLSGGGRKPSRSCTGRKPVQNPAPVTHFWLHDSL